MTHERKSIDQGRGQSTLSPVPPPSPARFLRHPQRNGSIPSTSSVTISATTLTNSNHDSTTIDITDLMTTASSQNTITNDPFSSEYKAVGDEDDDSDTQNLLFEKPHSLTRKLSTASNSTPVNGGANSSHHPIAATQLFAKNAAPLFLPQLDTYLASLPKPSFAGEKASSKPRMFVPMDRLEKSKKSLADLEMNSTVPPSWRNRRTILSSAVSLFVGILGSSAIAAYYSLQGVFNTVQVFALLLTTIVPVTGANLGSEWKELLLGTIPNVLALNFASTLTESVIFLVIFMVIAAMLLYRFFKVARNCERYNRLEGLQQVSLGKRWGIVIVTFLLTVIYLPISIMAIHVLVWSDDLWVVPNPYTNATSYPPVVPALGPASEYRDPLDFCWTTTMRKDEINYAPVIIILSMIVVCVLSISFPIILRYVIKKSVPHVDPYTELGRRRSKIDMDVEYHRVLARDQNPFAFIYSGFRRGWATYEATYLFAKLGTLVIVAVIDSDNCLFRNASRTTVPIVRQVLLLAFTVGFFLVQCFLGPFLDPVNNASEWMSRMNYVLTSTVALLVVLDVPGSSIIETYVLYGIYIITYGFTFYFIIINMAFMQRFVKRVTRRIDFSIDIFSPRLAISYLSPHAIRRIWQESITTLILTSPDCKIPLEQTVAFAQARDFEYPPYLLDFAGSPAERHVENLKILREVGSFEYRRAAALTSGSDFERYKFVEVEIQNHFIGPDSYWKNPNDVLVPGNQGFFGNAWFIPFPPTVVMRYDNGRLAVIRDLCELEEYVAQNSSRSVQRKREIRMALRALEGQTVRWPYKHINPVGSQLFFCCFRRKYDANATVNYENCVLKIKRKGYLVWDKVQIGSGFDIQLRYDKKVTMDGDIIGLTEDFDLTAPLARFLALNEDLIFARLGKMEALISSYRRHHLKECEHKARTLSYQFLTQVYDQPRSPKGLVPSFLEFERDLRVRDLIEGSELVFETAYTRLSVVSTTETATWWYIFWDDLWRRNNSTISNLLLHETDFNPYYPSSIAYTPLPRPILESFLTQRGLLSAPPKQSDFFNTGFLNKMYLRLNDAAFHGSSKAILFHLGDDASEHDMDGIDLEIQMDSPPSFMGSSRATGGGTNHDNSNIIVRPEYKWEGVLTDTLQHHRWRRKNLGSKLRAWLGISPVWRSGTVSLGLSVDVRLENGRYVLDNAHFRL